MREIRRLDLAMIDASDVVLVRIDPSVPACGTHFEMAYARSRAIPVVVLTDLATCNDWLFSEGFPMYQTIEEFANALQGNK